MQFNLPSSKPGYQLEVQFKSPRNQRRLHMPILRQIFTGDARALQQNDKNQRPAKANGRYE
ncbi:hypothetical protein SCA6_004663 [Theobroma cacao]